MLRVLGGPKRFCDGLTRRELLQVLRIDGQVDVGAGQAVLDVAHLAHDHPADLDVGRRLLCRDAVSCR